MAPITQLIARLGILFSDTNLVQGALAHKSYANEHPDRAYGFADSERLEFLGDSVLNYLAADALYRRFPNQSEGELTKLRAALIKTSTLAGFARQFDLGSYILMGKGERASGASDRDALLADTFEALLAAIYLDRGLDTAREFLAPLFDQQLAPIEAGRDADADDFKSQLLTLVQRQYGIAPTYQIVSVEGPEHQREFTAEVAKGDQRLGSGRGSSKQLAEQAAAQEALTNLNGGMKDAR